MKEKATLAWLSKAIREATTTSSNFQTSGELAAIDPGIEVEGLGCLTFPLQPAAIKKLKAIGRIAPYGKGTQTLVDIRVRSTIELDPSQFQLSDEWMKAIDQLTHKIGDDLGLNGELLEAHLYKLLMYEKGGHFLPHRDSEKLDRMVASLIVVLPNPFGGGELEVKHAGKTQQFDCFNFRHRDVPNYVAFYADCEHEVKRVTSGQRLCLVYNLVLNKPQEVSRVSKGENPLVDALRNWISVKPTEPLIFALEHQYTPKGLSQDLLKGADRPLVQNVLDAAEATECVATFAQLERHDTYSAMGEDDYYHRRSSRRSRRSEGYEVQDLIQQEFFAAEWTDTDGRKQSWGSLSLDISAVVGHTPVEDWVPTNEEYEGYTGNAGNTLDRWYHRTALIVWPRSRHYEILAHTGTENALSMFDAMMKKLPKQPKAKREEAHRDCKSFARGIISTWPVRWASWGDSDGKAKLYGAFPPHLLALADRELIVRFLAEVNLHDELTPLNALVVGACQQYGWAAFSKELSAFFQTRKSSRYAERQSLSLRDAQWLLALASETAGDPAKTQMVGKLCELAAELFLKKHPHDWRYRSKSGSSLAEKIVPVLLQALLAANRNDLAVRVIELVQSLPKEFQNETCQVPVLVLLVPWCQKQFSMVPAVISNWFATVRNEPMAATASHPQPPSDWKRPSEIECKCEHCGKVKTFLADPQAENYQLRGPEGVRAHVADRISRDQLDLKSTLLKMGSPYSLILKKTSNSHTRAVKQYETDVKLLEELSQVPM